MMFNITLLLVRTLRPIRLFKREIEIIKKTVREFDPEAEIYLFGSRASLAKRGGDIDLLVLSDRISWKERRAIRVELLLSLGDRKIDLIVEPKTSTEPLVRLAKEEGMRI
jgi:predicted nucleotidyltransferase